MVTIQRHGEGELIPLRLPLDLPIRFPVVSCHGFPTFPARADVVYLDTSYRSNRLWFRPVKSDRFFYVSVSHLTTSNFRQASKPVAFFGFRFSNVFDRRGVNFHGVKSHSQNGAQFVYSVYDSVA